MNGGLDLIRKNHFEDLRKHASFESWLALQLADFNISGINLGKILSIAGELKQAA